MTTTPHTTNFRVLSLFSGCGGLDLGIEGGFTYLNHFYPKNPFEIVWANDINLKATRTQKLNFPHTEVVCGDIVELLKNDLVLPDDIDIVLGGFPCQDFSYAGKRRGFDSERGQLFRSMAEVIARTQPKVFLAENVKGLLSWGNGLAIQTILDEFAKLGYHVEYKLLHTADYGVPQTRERVIIIGVHQDLHRPIIWPKPTHAEHPTATLKPWVTLKEAIDDLKSEEVQAKLPNFGYSKAKLFPGKQGNTITQADRPGPTMRAEHHGNIEFHYELPRRLSAREAARIQSFPDNFEFVSSITDAYRQIGNAVAPVFAWHLAQTLKKILEK